MIHPNKIPIWIRALLAFVLVAILSWMRIRMSLNAVLPFGYMVPIVLIAWLRSRPILWLSVIALVSVICAKQAMTHNAADLSIHGLARGSWGGTIVTCVNLLVLTGMCHIWLNSLSRIEAQNSQLAIANENLAARDVQIVNRNHELRMQTLELERKRDETQELLTEVARERTRYQTVLRTMPFPVVVADAACSDVRLNPAGAILFGALADSNIAGQMPEWILYHNGRPLPADHFPVMRACRDGIEVIADELELIMPGGKRAALLANARPIRDGDGKLIGAVAAFVDITPQKELQRELDLRRREAEEASVRKTRFLAAVSHDIRTPANAISLLAELIRRTALNPAMVGDIPELAAELNDSALSLINLLSDVLDLARFDSGKVELLESEFVLGSLLEEEHRQLLPLAREKRLDFRWSAPGEPIHLRADRIKLARILGNLIGNAIKFTESGQVRMTALPPDENGIRISVSDTGIGIPREFQRHIFDEFFQMRNPERDRTKGTGLGLTICRRLVDAMGGNLEVSSAPGEGSTFTVTLPLAVGYPEVKQMG